jgi:hypothetical protein
MSTTWATPSKPARPSPATPSRSRTDHSVGRVIHVIEQTGEMDNTLVIVVNKTEFLTGANADAERQKTALLPLFPPV